MSKNCIRFDYADNPKLRALFDGKRPGDKLKLVIKLQHNASDASGADGTIEEVAPGDEVEIVDESDEETAPAEKKPVEPTADEPVMVLVKGGKSKGYGEAAI